MVVCINYWHLFGTFFLIWGIGGVYGFCVAATNGNKKLMAVPMWKMPLLIIRAFILGPFVFMYEND